MELILLACCKRKLAGGSPSYAGSPVQRYLSAATFGQLQVLRAALAREYGLPSGPDLGGGDTRAGIAYLPAYERYVGHVYTRGRVRELYPQARDTRILIVSAIYGVVDAEDPIRLYDAEMGRGTARTGRLAAWWNRRGLQRIVEECILTLRPQRVHDLLSTVYRAALAPWPPRSLGQAGIAYTPYDFPGEGSGSQWRRGDKVQVLLTSPGRADTRPRTA